MIVHVVIDPDQGHAILHSIEPRMCFVWPADALRRRLGSELCGSFEASLEHGVLELGERIRS
jgi:hypothetical protein